MKEWGLKIPQVYCLVRDGDSKMKAACGNVELNDLHCFLHQLNLIVQENTETIDAVNQICTKVLLCLELFKK